MRSISLFLASMPPSEQDAFAARCGTTVNYLRKAVSAGQRLGLVLCVSLEKESGGAIKCTEIRPDVDWAFIRSTAAQGQGVA